MPNELKCQACRKSKRKCLRDGGDWNEQDPETRCNLCKTRDIRCGPSEFIPGREQRRVAADIRGTELPNLVPSRLIYSKEDLQRRMDELSKSETFNFVRETIGSKQNEPVPEELRRTLEDIETLADLAHDSNDISIAEVAYRRLIDWYCALGSEVKHPKERLWIKLGNFFEKIGCKYEAESWFLKIFDDLGRVPSDQNTVFQHAIRNFNTKDQASQDALMSIIRSCPRSRFKIRNEEGQTPLFLAVTLAEEEVVLAIMKRLRHTRPEVHRLIEQSYLNTRSYDGTTMLSAAITRLCSLPLIEVLIVYGSNVNPQTLHNTLTPLQASLYSNVARFDVAWLLNRYEAQWNDLGPNSEIWAQSVYEMTAPIYDSLLPALEIFPEAQFEN